MMDKVRQSMHDVNPQDVKQFFWEHMELDLKISCKILNITLDELLILLHKICFNFLSTRKNYLSDDTNSFKTKSHRQHWEAEFYSTYVAPIFVRASENVSHSNQLIQEYMGKDDSNQSKIYFMAYEILKKKNTESMYENEELWKFRPLISFSFMSQELFNHTKQEHYKILKKFAELIGFLEVTFNLPSIIRFVNMLKKNLNKNILKYKACVTTVREFLSWNEWSTKEVESSIKCFQYAWSMAKPYLNTYSKRILRIL